MSPFLFFHRELVDGTSTCWGETWQGLGAELADKLSATVVNGVPEVQQGTEVCKSSGNMQIKSTSKGHLRATRLGCFTAIQSHSPRRELPSVSPLAASALFNPGRLLEEERGGLWQQLELQGFARLVLVATSLPTPGRVKFPAFVTAADATGLALQERTLSQEAQTMPRDKVCSITSNEKLKSLEKSKSPLSL